MLQVQEQPRVVVGYVEKDVALKPHPPRLMAISLPVSLNVFGKTAFLLILKIKGEA